MKQSKSDIETFYKNPDPWGYKKNEEDRKRKQILLKHLKDFAPKEGFEFALDIGAGEGWITKDLPAKNIHAIEISDEAAKRFPKKVKRVEAPTQKYDLIIATGVMYRHYEYEKFLLWINSKVKPGGIVLLSNIRQWEVPEVQTNIRHKLVKTDVYKYREYEQKLRVYEAIS